MRIIGGIYKRRRFEVPRTFKARPTTDFAKENIFNVLNNYLDFDGTTALDLFAGTGSIGFEMVSRGCAKVISIEKDPAHYAFIRKVIAELNISDICYPIRGDVFKYIAGTSERFDLIFADPPYALPELPEIPERIMRAGLLRADGLLVLEHGKTHRFDTNPCFVEQRAYGSVHFSLFRNSAS
ncbi:MAG: RsmD family RNA methyltransferase [Prevotellaceae bacterium]|jgi:16S rRNA (guanine(966)-N(2))-methyltransferase RsmD|nr:RsmD family RNA methyltransferase [Prevotellaceae bacterium]